MDAPGGDGNLLVEDHRARAGASGLGARRAALLYMALGLAWISLSDTLVRRLSAEDPAIQQALQTAKGFLFVLLTGALLYVLVRRSERRVLALASEVRATVDSMLDGVIVVDDRSRIVEANRAAVALLGASSKDQILGPLEDWGRKFRIRSNDGVPLRPDRYAMAGPLASEPTAQFHAMLKRLDGRDIFVSFTASRVTLHGRPSLSVAVLRDVSLAHRLDEMREEFLATAAHELKTPLAVIKAYAQLMARREPAEVQPLSVIQRQVDRLTRIVEQLLDSSRLRLEPGAGRFEPFDLAELARSATDKMRRCAPFHSFDVHQDGLVPVIADRDRVERVVMSLLENAVRFSPGGGPVRVRVDAVDGEAQISVVDKGVGIPPEKQGQIFERYYRAHAGTPNDYCGLGLGLQIAREVVERQGGRMWFESAPGAGSTFHFGLPLSSMPSEAGAEREDRVP